MTLPELEYAWVDGAFIRSSEAQVPLLTHALQYGTGVFEGIRAYPGESGQLYVFRLMEHMQRLVNSARLCRIALPYTAAQLAEATVSLLRRCRVQQMVYIRPIAFVGYGGISLDFTSYPVRTAICAFYFKQYFERPGLRVCISSWRRFSDAATPAQAKACGNYLNSALARVEAAGRGCDEALLLDQDGHVSEGTGENVFLVREGALCTPPLSCAILEGITRDAVLRFARDTGMVVQERTVTRSELYTCDELFLTGTAAEITPVLEVDGITIGEGRVGVITQRFQKMLQEIVAGRNVKYGEWLTPVY